MDETNIDHTRRLKDAKRIIYNRARHREKYKKKALIVEEWKKLEQMVKE